MADSKATPPVQANPQPTSISSKKPPRLGRGLSTLMAHPVQVPQQIPSIGNLDRSDKSGPSDSKRSHTTNQTIITPNLTPKQPKLGTQGELTYLSLGSIRPNPHQPRQTFAQDSLQRLSESIRNDGVMQPIIVRQVSTKTDGSDATSFITYELVAGERRLRAAELAGLAQIPAIVRPLNDRQLAEWALIENIQREDLNPMDRANAFHKLGQQFGLSHDDIAQQVGIDRSTVSNSLRLLSLCDNCQRLVREGLLSAGQAKALVAVSDPAQQELLAQRMIAHGWSVRRVEQEIRRLTAAGGHLAEESGPSKPVARSGSHLRDLEEQLSRQLETKVKIRPGRRKGSGTLSIEFYSLDQFDSLLRRLKLQVEMD